MSVHESTSTTPDSSTFAEHAERAVDLVRGALDLLALSMPKMTPRQRRHGLKFRKGVEPSIRAVAQLSDDHGVVVPGMPTSAMRDSMDRIAALRTVRLALVGTLSAVDGAIFEEQAAAYGTALTLYGMLKKVAHRHLEIRAKLAPVAEFFSYRRRAKTPEDLRTRSAPEA